MTCSSGTRSSPRTLLCAVLTWTCLATASATKHWTFCLWTATMMAIAAKCTQAWADSSRSTSSLRTLRSEPTCWWSAITALATLNSWSLTRHDKKKMELLSRKADQEDREAQERYEEARQKYEKARDERELTQSDEIELVEPPPPKKKTGLFGSERLNRVMDVGLTPDLFTAPGEGPEDLLPLVAKTLKPKTGELQSKRGREKLMTTRAQKLFFMDKPIVPANEAIEKYSQFLSDNPDKTAEELDSGKWYQKVVDSPDALVVLNWREMFTALSATQARLVIFSICNGPKSPFVKEDPSVEDMQKSLSFSDERDDNSFYYAYIRSNCVADRSQIRDCLTGSMSVVLTCLQAAGFVIRRYDGEWTSDE
eukprot:gnl/Spiro4/15808_TR8506_c0_g1_i1.p2 gnl/Spiro4/15808_TR8506_c0_g1~~gnl/Spiro4/15808_TR8506_c0_g1_i1.p2  ORF type:complete len:366 (+),score=77.42 gnl/Spiro4/15808_TR8506_c0_g1_i1:251-1348(+)